MPRIRRSFAQPTRKTDGELVEQLVDELKNERESGQPIIEEEEYPTEKIRVLVIWDAWDRIPHGERTAVILSAYETVEGADFRNRIALASGVTVPEAHASGMLPYQIIAATRKTDPVNLAQCQQAMIEEGASTLFGESDPQLRFATEEEAIAARKRLSARLPESEPVWVITKEVGVINEQNQN